MAYQYSTTFQRPPNNFPIDAPMQKSLIPLMLQEAYLPPTVQGSPHNYPCVGFTLLLAKFYIRNVMTSAGTSCLELRLQVEGPVVCSAKIFSSSRLKIKEGPYESGKPPVCLIEILHTLNSKSTISFNEFQTQLKEPSTFHHGDTWPFEVQVNMQLQAWRLTKLKSESVIKSIIGTVPQSSLEIGNSYLHRTPAGLSPRSHPQMGTHLRIMQRWVSLRSAVRWWPMDRTNVLANVAIAVLPRIISQHYISRIAALAS